MSTLDEHLDNSDVDVPDEVESEVQLICDFSERWLGKVVRPHQKDMMRRIVGGGDRILELTARGHGKSTVIFIYLMYRICHNLDLRIMIVCNTEEFARSRCREITRAIENNDELREHFGIVKGKPWRLGESYLKGRAQALLIGKATTARVTGRRWDITVLDDVLVEEDTYNERTMRRIKSWLYSEVKYAMDPALRKTIICGTRKGMHDLYDEWLANPDYSSHVGAAIIKDEHGNDCPLWPWEEEPIGGYQGGFKLEDLYKDQREEPKFFAREMMNRPAPEEGYRFRREDIRTWQALPHREFLRYFIGIDPAYGKEKRSSMTAFCVIAYDDRDGGIIYVVEMFKDRMSLLEQVDKAEELSKKYQPEAVIVESELMFGVMYEEYERRVPRTQKLEWPDKMSKELRIESTLAPLFRDRQLKIRNPEMDHFTNIFVETELLEFGGMAYGSTPQNRTPMDLLDALCISLYNIDFSVEDDGPVIRSWTPAMY